MFRELLKMLLAVAAAAAPTVTYGVRTSRCHFRYRRTLALLDPEDNSEADSPGQYIILPPSLKECNFEIVPYFIISHLTNYR